MTLPARRRRAVAGVLVVLVLGVTAGVAASRIGATTVPDPAAAARPDPVTAPVEFGALDSGVRLAGQLGYGEATPLPVAAGVITALPAAGQVVDLGAQVYEMDGVAVVLFRGSRPFWRDLDVDSDDGEDVRQLEENLDALGFPPGPVDTRFDWGTRQALRDWQKSRGVPQTGAFTPSAVVVADTASIRIQKVDARLGQSGVSPASVTSTTLRVTARVSEAQAARMQAGAPASVSLPDGSAVEASVAEILPAAAATSKDDSPTPPIAVIDIADPARVAGVGAVAVRVVIEQAAEQDMTLLVPATALLAAADGSYAVERWDGTATRRVPVRIGTAADGRVQILESGSAVTGVEAALAEGDTVVVAK